MSPERIWFGKDAGATLLRTVLAPMSGLYWLGWQAYLSLYSSGLKKSKEPHKPVICVGNMTVGGSGKSPTTLHVAKVLQSLGKEVVISASGYGSPASEGATFAPAGELDASQWGDEPAMIRWLMPGAPLIVGRNRVEAARLCHERFPQAVLLMDDGLQHLPLKQHITLALDEGAQDNSLVLPAGPYREPRSNLGRATATISANPSGITGFTLAYGDSIFRQVFPEVTEDVRLTSVAVVTAIARPHRLMGSIRETGIRIEAQEVLPDHDPMTAGNLFDRLPADLPLLVTAKDWVKLRQRQDLQGRTIVVALREAHIEPVPEFRTWLQSKLDEQA